MTLKDLVRDLFMSVKFNACILRWREAAISNEEESLYLLFKTLRTWNSCSCKFENYSLDYYYDRAMACNLIQAGKDPLLRWRIKRGRYIELCQSHALIVKQLLES